MAEFHLSLTSSELSWQLLFGMPLVLCFYFNVLKGKKTMCHCHCRKGSCCTNERIGWQDNSNTYTQAKAETQAPQHNPAWPPTWPGGHLPGKGKHCKNEKVVVVETRGQGGRITVTTRPRSKHRQKHQTIHKDKSTQHKIDHIIIQWPVVRPSSTTTDQEDCGINSDCLPSLIQGVLSLEFLSCISPKNKIINTPMAQIMCTHE